MKHRKVIRDIKKVLVLAKRADELLGKGKYSKIESKLKRILKFDLDELSRLKNGKGDTKLVDSCIVVYQDTQKALRLMQQEDSLHVDELIKELINLEGFQLSREMSTTTKNTKWKIKFDSVTPIVNHGENIISIGMKDGIKYLIKEYRVNSVKKAEAKEKWDCETLCYQHLSRDSSWRRIMPRYVEGSIAKRYIITEFIDGENIRWSKDTVELIVSFFQGDIIRKTDARFLPKRGYTKKYTKLLVGKAKSVPDLRSIDIFEREFHENAALIEAESKHFSHGDPRDGNVMVSNGKVYLIDFESSRRDNLMYDLAAVYVDLCNRSLQRYYYSKIVQFDFYDEKLFRLMVLRRCIQVAFTFYTLDITHEPHYPQSVKIFNTLIEGKTPW
jgi:serine/threonine protein kinase